MELVAGRCPPDEEYMDLSSLNFEVYREYEEHKAEIYEEIEIPPEEESQLDSAEIQRRTANASYFSQLDLAYPLTE